MCSIIPTTLAGAITSNWSNIAGENFQHFLTTSCLCKDKERGWIYVRDIRCHKYTKLEYIEELAKELVLSGPSVANIVGIESLVSRLNEEWTKEVDFQREIDALLKEDSSSSSILETPSTSIASEELTLTPRTRKRRLDSLKLSSKPIKFDENDKKYCWLAPHFPSLIYSEEVLTNQEKVKSIFYCLETYYQSKRLSEDLKKSDYLKYCTNPLEATVYANKDIPEIRNCRAEFERRSAIIVEGMFLKYSQNKVLRKKLLATKLAALYYSSTSAILGIGSDNRGLNLIGKVSIHIRSSYATVDTNVPSRRINDENKNDENKKMIIT